MHCEARHVCLICFGTGRCLRLSHSCLLSLGNMLKHRRLHVEVPLQGVPAWGSLRIRKCPGSDPLSLFEEASVPDIGLDTIRQRDAAVDEHPVNAFGQAYRMEIV